MLSHISVTALADTSLDTALAHARDSRMLTSTLTCSGHSRTRTRQSQGLVHVRVKISTLPHMRALIAGVYILYVLACSPRTSTCVPVQHHQLALATAYKASTTTHSAVLTAPSHHHSPLTPCVSCVSTVHHSPQSPSSPGWNQPGPTASCFLHAAADLGKSPLTNGSGVAGPIDLWFRLGLVEKVLQTHLHARRSTAAEAWGVTCLGLLQGGHP